MAITNTNLKAEIAKVKGLSTASNNIPLQLGNEVQLKLDIETLVDIIIGSTDTEKREELPILINNKKLVRMIITRLYDDATTPFDKKEIHGGNIKPILKTVIAEKLAALPPLPQV